jgi:DNA-directed RNA polymerase specialized sigma24 family protein
MGKHFWVNSNTEIGWWALHGHHYLCLSHVGQTAAAEDLTQEVFMQVAHDLAALREPDKFLP